MLIFVTNSSMSVSFILNKNKKRCRKKDHQAPMRSK